MKSLRLGIVCFTAINNGNKQWYPNVVCCYSESVGPAGTGFAKGWWPGDQKPEHRPEVDWMSGESCWRLQEATLTVYILAGQLAKLLPWSHGR